MFRANQMLISGGKMAKSLKWNEIDPFFFGNNLIFPPTISQHKLHQLVQISSPHKFLPIYKSRFAPIRWTVAYQLMIGLHCRWWNFVNKAKKKIKKKNKPFHTIAAGHV